VDALLDPDREHATLDALEAAIVDGLPVVHMPVVHRFVPQLYLREIFMPAGTVLTSRVHLTEHPFVVLSGVALVRIPGQEPIRLAAGHVGITRAGTRRALYIEEDCRWLTCHPLSSEEEAGRVAGLGEAELLALIEARIIGKRERGDGRDMLSEYKRRLEAAGLPGVHDGAAAAPPILAGSRKGSERASLPERQEESTS
jgi:quercetin dioxygenase-like cupin family protein